MSYRYPKLKSWNKDTDCCSWDGVECNTKTGKAITLDLSCNCLQGTIHPNSTLFHYFPHLQRLRLISSNGLRGNFPLRLFHLPRLVELDLSENNALPGHFPKVIINSKSLLPIFIPFITAELPHSLENLKFLIQLDVSCCKLYGPIPASLGNLTQLTYLKLSVNNFSVTLPSSLLNLKNLIDLYLSNNDFRGTILEFFSNFGSLGYVTLRSNNFTVHSHLMP